MKDLFVTVVVFFALYQIIKMFTDFLLKRRVIKSEHFDQADILASPREDENEGRYPTLKWGLVCFMAGIGLLISNQLYFAGKMDEYSAENSMAAFGMELVFISAGFLIYFLIVTLMKKKK